MKKHWTLISGGATSFVIGLLAFSFGPEIALAASVAIAMGAGTWLVVMDELESRR